MINACPLTPTKVSHEFSAGTRHKILVPSLITNKMSMNKAVVDNVIRVITMLLFTDVRALRWFTKIPCAENTNGNAIQRMIPR